MRYIFILMMLMSFSVHAEWRSNGGNVYSQDIELNPLTQRVSVQLLIDDVPGDSSIVNHMQYQCDNGVPTKERNFWHAYYEGRMGTGNAAYGSEGAPWVPHEDNRFTWIAIKLCIEMDRRSERNSPERNPLY